jgi:2-C-methyl-D-erythritol 4-phosphate cytidylyltransferase
MSNRGGKNMNAAIITAAGIGTRMHQYIPKQFLHVDNKPIIIYTLEAFQRHPGIDAIVVVCLDGWHDILRAYAKQFGISKLKWIVSGGSTGQESIRRGLWKLKEECGPDDTVIVHDGNRPMVSSDIISDCLFKYNIYGNAVAAIPCVEVVFKCEEPQDKSSSIDTIPREQLLRTQTPQAYKLSKLVWAHEEAAKRGISNMSASCDLMAVLGEMVYFSAGSEKNLKITTMDDLEIFEALLKSAKYEL